MNKLGVTIIPQLSQRNGELPLKQRKQGNYPVIPIYVSDNISILCLVSMAGGGWAKKLPTKERNYFIVVIFCS